MLFADRAYKQFDQIFISYGPRPNSDLLLLYGFALDRNPFNSVDLVVGANADQDPLFDQKRAFAASAGRDVARAAFPLYADRYPDELVQFLRMPARPWSTSGICLWMRRRRTSTSCRWIMS